MSPCIAPTNGRPPKMYGFHSGTEPVRRHSAAPNQRNGRPAQIWSPPGLTSSFPANAGRNSTTMKTIRIPKAAAVGRWGSNVGAVVSVLVAISSLSGEGKNGKHRDDLGRGHQDARARRDQGRRGGSVQLPGQPIYQ